MIVVTWVTSIPFIPFFLPCQSDKTDILITWREFHPEKDLSLTGLVHESQQFFSRKYGNCFSEDYGVELRDTLNWEGWEKSKAYCLKYTEQIKCVCTWEK